MRRDLKRAPVQAEPSAGGEAREAGSGPVENSDFTPDGFQQKGDAVQFTGLKDGSDCIVGKGQGRQGPGDEEERK